MKITKIKTDKTTNTNSCPENITLLLKDIRSLGENIVEQCGTTEPQAQEIDSLNKSLHECIRKLCYKLRVFRSFTLKEDYATADTSSSLTMSYENGIYHYILNDLLPHRNYENDYFHDKDLIYNGYRAGVEKFLMKNHLIPFDERILVYFKNHISLTGQITDNDNFEPKIFIDAAINKVIVCDDNQNYVSFLMESIEDKEVSVSYTEVYAGKYDDIVQIMLKKY